MRLNKVNSFGIVERLETVSFFLLNWILIVCSLRATEVNLRSRPAPLGGFSTRRIHPFSVFLVTTARPGNNSFRD